MREQNDPSRIPKPPPPSGPGTPGRPTPSRRPDGGAGNQPNTGVPVREERTRDDPIEKAPVPPSKSGGVR